MKAFCSFLRIVGLLALIGSLAPACDGEFGSALFAAVLGLALIFGASALGEAKK